MGDAKMITKRIFFLILSILLCLEVASQTRGFDFTGYAIDGQGLPIAATGVTVKFTIYDKDQPSVNYEEEQSFSSDASGIFSATIGSESLFGNLSFSSRDFWMKVEVKRTIGDGAFNTISDSRLNAVPYAKSAENACPAGYIVQFAGSTAPPGWHLCDGSAISRAAFADLFAVIGTAYGSGDGNTTFNLPNLKTRIPVGRNNVDADFNILGKTGGSTTRTLTMPNLPSHSHESGSLVTSSQGNHGHSIRPYSASSVTSSGCITNCNDRVLYNSDGELMNDGHRTTSYEEDHDHDITGITANEGGDVSFNIMQPYLTINYIIRVY